MDMMVMNADTLIAALHAAGVLLAMVLKDRRWVGIWPDSAGRFWLVEGKADQTIDVAKQTVDHCYFDTYDEAMTAFRKWWEKDFKGVPNGPPRSVS